MSDYQIQLVIAGAACVTGVATGFLAWFVYGQLGAIRDQVSLLQNQISTQVNEEKKWRTLAICEDYWKDPTVNVAIKALWENTADGQDYTKLAEFDRDAIHVVDYLDSLAIGIAQGVYEEKIVKDHMEDVIRKAVKALILGEPESIHGRDWKADKVIIPRDYYPHLVALYSHWFAVPPKTYYKSAQ